MNTNTIHSLRNGGMSRRGFLRAMGVTACAALVPGLVYPIYRSGTQFVREAPRFYRMNWKTKNARGRFTMDAQDYNFIADAVDFANRYNAKFTWDYLNEEPKNWWSIRRRV